MYKCQSCGTKKELYISTTYYKKNGSKTIWYICRKCNTQRIKKYRKGNIGSEKIRQAVYKSILKYPEKQKARILLNSAVKCGKIKKMPCEICGDKKSHAHHEDYSKPLEIKWLCRRHHSDHHKGNIFF